MAEDIPKVQYNHTADEAKKSAKWWSLPDNEIFTAIFSRCKSIADRQSYRKTFNERHARLYSNLEFQALTAGRYADVNVSKLPQNRVTWNLAKACVDTAAAKIAKNKPLPLFLTEKGAWSKQRKGKQLSQYVGGMFDANDAYEKGQQVFTHSGIYGTGCMKVWPDKEAAQVKMDWVYIHEILVDDVEAYYGNPRCVYHWCVRPRELVMDQWGKTPALIEAIRSAMPASASQIPYADTHSDMIEVIESWHLPSGPNAKDGKHVIAISGAALVSEEWKQPWFPLVFFKWSPPIVGFYGSGIIYEVEGVQVEINKLLRDISAAQHLVGKPRVFVDNATQLSRPITSEIGAIYKHAGPAPTFSTVPSMHPEIYQHLDRLWARGFEQVGISQLSATSKKPSGLDSGKALREFNDIETERFVLVGQRYETFYLRIAKIAIALQRELQKELAESGKKLTVKVKSQKFLKQIDWSEVDLEEDQYIMQAFPTSFLRTTPAGRLEDVQDLLKGGLIGKDVALLLLDFPDLQNFMSLENSSLQVALMMMEKIVEDGEYIAPEPFMDLNSALKIAQNTYNQAKLEGAPEKNLEKLIQFMNQCHVMIKRAQAPAEPVPGAAPALPQAPPQGPVAPGADQSVANGMPAPAGIQ